MKPSRKKLWVSAACIAVCVAVIVAVTLVFTLGGGDSHVQVDKPPVTVVKGELKPVLLRERLEKVTIRQTDGLPYTDVDTEVTNFTDGKGNVFGIDTNTVVGPNCYFKADLAISNSKPYPFEYFLEIVPKDGKNLLVDQLQITVTVEGQTLAERTLSDGLTVRGFPAVPAGEQARFAVKMQYLDLKDNDKTQNTTLTFDLIVHTVLTTN